MKTIMEPPVQIKKHSQINSPVFRLEKASQMLGANIRVKSDANIHGGSHGRKIPLLLDEAERRGAKRIICLGGVGGNFCPSVAAHAIPRNIKVECVVIDQPQADPVPDNILRMLHYGGTIHYASKHKSAAGYPGIAAKALALFLHYWRKDGVRPFYIRPGGGAPFAATALGLAVGELKQQIEQGECPKPDALFLAVSTCGTISGILAGLAKEKLDIEVFGVRVSERHFANRIHIRQITKSVLKKLGSDQRMPPYTLVKEYSGECYGAQTEKSIAAVKTAAEDNMILETTYTGKAYAALLDYCAKAENKSKNVMFWNTLGNTFPKLDPKDFEIPQELMGYFSDSK